MEQPGATTCGVSTNFVLTRSMRNVTVKLGDETAEWVRVRAAGMRTSVSRFLGDLLAEQMRSSRQYDSARHACLAQTLRPLCRPDEPYPRREDLDARPGVR